MNFATEENRRKRKRKIGRNLNKQLHVFFIFAKILKATKKTRLHAKRTF